VSKSAGAMSAAPGADVRLSRLPPADDLDVAYLHAGHIFVSRMPCRVTTILGSCVAVGLWDPVTRVGGLNHFLLPQYTENGLSSPRFGNVAIHKLIEAIVAAGGRRKQFKAKLFGGACVLQAFQRGSGRLGERNVHVARAVLAEEGIPVCAEDVEGERGRKLIFQTHDGTAWVRSL
jgi:chemotaxis protein CheD